MQCANCGNENPENSRFCNYCGQSLLEIKSISCPKCGADNPVNANFCQECGYNLTTKEFNPEGSADDFRSDLELLNEFKDEIDDLIKNTTIKVPQDENTDAAIDEKVKEVEKGIKLKKRELDSRLKVLNSDLIIIDLKKDDNTPYKFDFILNLDKEGLNKYVEYYKNKESETTTKIKGENDWKDSCPVCKSAKLNYRTHKGALGLSTINTLECDNCGAIFEEKGNKYKLAKIQFTNQNVWKKYHNQTLKEDEWVRIANGGVSDAEQRKMDLEKQERERKELEALKEQDINQFLTELQNGEIDINIKDPSPVILKKNEKLSMILNNISLHEPRAVRQTVGGYAGPTVRVAKGLSFRMGRIAAKSESHEELRNIDQGKLVLTTKRLIFIGSKRTTTIDLSKIVAIEAYSDGIESQRENKQKAEYFTGSDKNTLKFNLNGRSNIINVTGVVLKAAIQGNIAQL